ncbi:MAG: hypothetical protein QM758_14080 [Armatimonas sp.]
MALRYCIQKVMQVHYVPLLARQREIYEIPRGIARFREYISTIVNPEGDDLAVFPLVAMNPMGKEHCTALLDQYLAMGADEIAQQEMIELLPLLLENEGVFRLSLVLVDDAKGGWTNRIDYEFKTRVGPAAVLQRYPWISVMLWTSDSPLEQTVCESVRLALCRADYALTHGDPQTLQDLLIQEGQVQCRARVTPDPLTPEEQEYTRAVLQPHLSANGMPTIIAALFGDEGAAALGYPPLGLEKDAGLRLAWHDAS